ncbi:MAG: hypothetical protein JW881_01795 [Spirochaetales bacterium]|nr:hypothetical protein [Spirochaetales bacterium]
MRKAILHLFFFIFSAMITVVHGYGIDEVWAMYYMTQADDSELDREIGVYEAISSPIPEDDISLAILYIHKYLRTGKTVYSDKAHKRFKILKDSHLPDYLVIAYMGMSSSFQAKKKTIFGADDLKAMAASFRSIPEHIENWFIRFLRGTSCYEVGKKLPDIWIMGEIKKEALDMGKADLAYVLSCHDKANILSFTLSGYDRKRKPVPESVRKTIEEILEK